MRLKADICIIGAGSGGLSVAAGAAQLGLKTILTEKDKMGGDCLNTGCVPSKALLAAAAAAHTIRTAGKFGITETDPAIDFPAIKKHVADVIKAIEPNDSVERFEKMGVQVIKGTARFTGRKTICVGDDTVKARYFVIATGSSPSIPPIRGLDKKKILTNETIFDLQEKPEHLVVVGGGPIGVEMAQAHRRLGCAVTIIDMGPILPKDDPELVAVIRKALSGEGISFKENTAIESVEHNDNGIIVRTDQGIVSGTHILIAAGRKPNVDDLGLEEAGVDFSGRGIQIDDTLRTTNKKIFSIGDVSGGPQFTHAAGYHAGIVIQRAIFKSPFAKTDYTALPWVTYTDPELAHVGMTEEQARDKYGDQVTTLYWDGAENDRAQTIKNTEGKIKVVVGKKGRILGATISAKDAGEIIPLWTLALHKKMTIKDIATMIMPYPVLSEISKRAAGSFYTPILFGEKTKKIVRLLKYLPI